MLFGTAETTMLIPLPGSQSAKSLLTSVIVPGKSCGKQSTVSTCHGVVKRRRIS